MCLLLPALQRLQSTITLCFPDDRPVARSYEFSKMRKFLTLSRFQMEDTLRFLVEESLTRLGSFMAAACGTKVRGRGWFMLKILRVL
jgi:hypothetical protein